jgi:hypothetical protein
MTGLDFHPSMAESPLNEVFAEIRYVSAQTDTRHKNSKSRVRDPYGLGDGEWYHLAVAHNMEEYGLKPSAHIDGIWHTTFVRLRPAVSEALKPRLMWPPSGFCVTRHPTTRQPWITASGNGSIGGCTVCYLAAPSEEPVTA